MGLMDSVFVRFEHDKGLKRRIIAHLAKNCNAKNAKTRETALALLSDLLSNKNIRPHAVEILENDLSFCAEHISPIRGEELDLVERSTEQRSTAQHQPAGAATNAPVAAAQPAASTDDDARLRELLARYKQPEKNPFADILIALRGMAELQTLMDSMADRRIEMIQKIHELTPEAEPDPPPDPWLSMLAPLIQSQISKSGGGLDE